MALMAPFVIAVILALEIGGLISYRDESWNEKFDLKRKNKI